VLWGRKLAEQKGLNAFCRRSIRPSPKVCNLPKKVTNPGAPVRWAIRVQPIEIVRDAKPRLLLFSASFDKEAQEEAMLNV
jgi:hypothetical protein